MARVRYLLDTLYIQLKFSKLYGLWCVLCPVLTEPCCHLIYLPMNKNFFKKKKKKKKHNKHCLILYELLIIKLVPYKVPICMQEIVCTVFIILLNNPVKSYVVKWPKEKEVCHFYDDATPLSCGLQVTKDFLKLKDLNFSNFTL